MKDTLRTSNQTRWIVLIITSALSILIGLTLRSWYAQQSVKAAVETPIPVAAVLAQTSTLAVEQPAIAATVAVVPTGKPTEPTPPRQIVNNMAVWADNFRQEPGRWLVDVCYDLPNAADWTIFKGWLRDGQTELMWSGSIPIVVRKPPVDGKQDVYTFITGSGFKKSIVDGDAIQSAIRCDTMYFDGPLSTTAGTSYTLTIDALEASPSEGAFCDPEYLKKAQSALDARNTGITVKCVEEQYMAGLEIAGKPAAMRMEDAEAILYSEDFYIDMNAVRGPWVFVFTN